MMTRYILAAFLMVGVLPLATAQPVLPAAVPLESEDLETAPQIPAQPLVQKTLTVATSISATTATPAGNPFVISGVSVTPSGTTGFDRDSALILAARQALPQALKGLTPPITSPRAEEIANSVGNPMAFVSSYKIEKETLVPTYALRVELKFNEKMLADNFGKLTGTTSVKTVHISETTVFTSPDPTQQAGQNVWYVRLDRGTPQEQDRLANLMRQIPGTSAKWQLISRESSVLELHTPLSVEELADQLRVNGLQVTPAGALLDVSF